MIEFKEYKDIPKDFNGILKHNNTIYYLKNGKKHREDGPSTIHEIHFQEWCLNGVEHRENGAAVIYFDGTKEWYYKGKCYGINNKFTNTTWINFVKDIKYKESLNIFK